MQLSEDISLQSLRAVKQALGRVGHDFGNLLTPLLAYPPLIGNDLAPDSKSHELLELVEKTAQDMVQVARQMLDLALSDDFSVQTICVNDVVEAAVCASRSDLPDELKWSLSLCSDETRIDGGEDQLARAVQKICQNASEAMSGQGVVEVSTARITVPTDKAITSGCLSAGEYIAVSVCDSGPGIPAKDRKRALQPFYTTKRDRAKRGAGLGLCYVHLVSAAHGGGVDIDSVEPDGCRVTLYLGVTNGSSAAKGPTAG